MDELEVLKKQWQSREQEFPKLTAKDIYPMLLKKSSSIVKWIFIISIAEIALWTVLYFLIPESSKKFQEGMGLSTLFTALNIVNYAVVFVFIYFFYKNHQKIQATNTVKKLMENILKTRKTVHYFVYYNIGMAAILMFITNLYYYFNKEQLYQILNSDDLFAAVPAETFILFNVIGGIIIIAFLILFYWLLYGLLLRRLKKNYKRLKKIED
ncbi:MAG: hypothetical protein CL596_09915 [Alteromonas sp.]|nr:hypothetical protein [Alteromonas sp.]MAY23120.1 hypothetical protein [Flavobacteriaceae bacterium]|tara:strand:- start:167717 stop:168349 length:633 start_codon:yes stop_codon:yes gene_type:complete